jgi:preprotein translocase subunit YajC
MASAGEAWAQPAAPQPPGAGGFLASLLPFVVIVVLFYFLLIAPQRKQQKQHKAMLEALKKGDRVMTSGGILGTVANIHKDVVTLQVADHVKLKVARDHIAGLREPTEEPAVTESEKK